MSDLHASVPVVEALIFSAGSPIGLAQLKRVLPDLSSTQLRSIVGEINGALEKEDRPYEIAEVAGGYQFRTRPEFAEQIRAMQPERKLRLSRPALETLSVIAYRQPVTRAEIEDLLTDGELSRHRVVMTFLAILELVRIQVLHIFQNVGESGAPSGPVRVRLAVEPDAIPAQNP